MSERHTGLLNLLLFDFIRTLCRDRPSLEPDRAWARWGQCPPRMGPGGAAASSDPPVPAPLFPDLHFTSLIRYFPHI